MTLERPEDGVLLVEFAGRPDIVGVVPAVGYVELHRRGGHGSIRLTGCSTVPGITG